MQFPRRTKAILSHIEPNLRSSFRPPAALAATLGPKLSVGENHFRALKLGSAMYRFPVHCTHPNAFIKRRNVVHDMVRIISKMVPTERILGSFFRVVKQQKTCPIILVPKNMGACGKWALIVPDRSAVRFLQRQADTP